MSERIVCIAVNEAQVSQSAFDWYVNNYHKASNLVLLVHIHIKPKVPLTLGAGSMSVTENYTKILEESARKSKEMVNEYEAKCREKNMKYKIELQDELYSPGYMICDIATKHNAELVVMGQRGLGPFGRALLGSTSDYVLHHINIPVVIIPPKI